MHDSTTHGIVHAGFSGFRSFVARKKSRCILTGNRFVLPHDTIPENVLCHSAKADFYPFVLRTPGLKEMAQNESVNQIIL